MQNYHSDNGVFTKSQFRDALLQAGQAQQVSGVGAHHQNGPAEQAIWTIQDMTRAMMLHMSVHWPDEYDTQMWPFAMDYVTWLYNHTPQKESRLAPMEIFCGTKLNCENLRCAKVFGSPTYVLDPKLADNFKIPKWSARACLGQFLGFSKLHSSSVGLIRNIRTNYVTPQFHTIYDQTFSTLSGGLSNRTMEQLDPDNFQLFLKSKWKSDDHINTLDEWDEAIDGPLPNTTPNWDANKILAPMQTSSTPYTTRPSMPMLMPSFPLTPTIMLTKSPTTSTLPPFSEEVRRSPSKVSFDPVLDTILAQGGEMTNEPMDETNTPNPHQSSADSLNQGKQVNDDNSNGAPLIVEDENQIVSSQSELQSAQLPLERSTAEESSQ